jgi:hypothetical protein
MPPEFQARAKVSVDAWRYAVLKNQFGALLGAAPLHLASGDKFLRGAPALPIGALKLRPIGFRVGITETEISD